ncbi:MAG: hypothetical protein MI717_13195 [Spirochaetales bacterium]|nr:hypothetical protein [Spirochaetales bacterium]
MRTRIFFMLFGFTLVITACKPSTGEQRVIKNTDIEDVQTNADKEIMESDSSIATKVVELDPFIAKENIIGTWEIPNSYNPQRSLVFSESNQFFLKINHCAGILVVSGEYQIQDNQVLLDIIDCVGCDPKSEFTWPSLTLRWVGADQLEIEQDFFYWMNNDRLGVCAPNKGEIFVPADVL